MNRSVVRPDFSINNQAKKVIKAKSSKQITRAIGFNRWVRKEFKIRQKNRKKRKIIINCLWLRQSGVVSSRSTDIYFMGAMINNLTSWFMGVFIVTLVLGVRKVFSTSPEVILVGSAFSEIQRFIGGMNLTPLSMDGLFNTLHNTIIMAWVLGIFILVLRLVFILNIQSATTKNISSSRLMETLWLLIPSGILLAIATPRLWSLYFLDGQQRISLNTLKTTGRQWYWSYEWINTPEESTITSYALPANSDILNYLSRDQELILQSNTEFINLVSASDVIHCWTIPRLLVKVDAIPGRVRAARIYIPIVVSIKKLYGQCSELCGTNHSFIPITAITF